MLGTLCWAHCTDCAVLDALCCVRCTGCTLLCALYWLRCAGCAKTASVALQHKVWMCICGLLGSNNNDDDDSSLRGCYTVEEDRPARPRKWKQYYRAKGREPFTNNHCVTSDLNKPTNCLTQHTFT